MYHSIDITTLPGRGNDSLTFNTYKDFYLVPTALPVISPPSVKTKTIDIPGANGAIDLTESLTPFPVYKNRTGSLEFAVLNDRYEYYNRYKNAPHSVKSLHAIQNDSAWTILYADLTNKLHGRKCRLVLEDDPEWYYEGRIAINAWKTSNDGKWPIVTIDYDLSPYKLSVDTSITGATETGTDRWKWNPFSFVDGVIYSSDGVSLPNGFTADGVWKNITVNTDSYTTYGIVQGSSTIMNKKLTGWMPACPSITVAANSTGMGIKIINPELGYTYEKEFTSATSAKTYTDPECLLYDYLGNGYTLQLKGHGTFTINFRKGSL